MKNNFKILIKSLSFFHWVVTVRTYAVQMEMIRGGGNSVAIMVWCLIIVLGYLPILGNYFDRVPKKRNYLFWSHISRI